MKWRDGCLVIFHVRIIAGEIYHLGAGPVAFVNFDNSIEGQRDATRVLGLIVSGTYAGFDK